MTTSDDPITLPALTPGGANARNHNPVLIGVLMVVAAGAVGVAVWEAWPRADPPPEPGFAYYTADGGATFFVDDAERLPPFDHGGKPAVRAEFFSCDGGKTRFAGYFEKLPEAVLAKLLAGGRDPKSIDDDEVAAVSGWLVRRPGDAGWTNSKEEPTKFAEIRHVRCPDGGTPEAVLPEARE